MPEGPSMLRPYQLAKGGDENPQKNWGNTWIRYTNNLWSFFFWLRNIWCSDLLFLLFLNRVWDAIGSWAVSRSTFGGRLEDNIPPQNHGSFSNIRILPILKRMNGQAPHHLEDIPLWEVFTRESFRGLQCCNKSGSIGKSKLFKTILQNLY